MTFHLKEIVHDDALDAYAQIIELRPPGFVLVRYGVAGSQKLGRPAGERAQRVVSTGEIRKLSTPPEGVL